MENNITMGRKIKRIVSTALAAVSLAMGVAVIVMATISADIAITDLIKMLAVAAASLGIFALNSIPNEE